METPTPKKAIPLAFDEFGWNELETEARAAGITADALIERAVAEFLRELSDRDGERLALEVPDASRGEPAEKPISAEVILSASQLSALEDEAERQEVPIPRLVEHATFHYLVREDIDDEAG